MTRGGRANALADIASCMCENKWKIASENKKDVQRCKKLACSGVISEILFPIAWYLRNHEKAMGQVRDANF